MLLVGSELLRISLPRTPVYRGEKKGRGVVPRPAERLVEPVYPLAVARDYVRIVDEHFIVPAPAGDTDFPRRIVDGDDEVVTGAAGEGVQRPPWASPSASSSSPRPPLMRSAPCLPVISSSPGPPLITSLAAGLSCTSAISQGCGLLRRGPPPIMSWPGPPSRVSGPVPRQSPAPSPMSVSGPPLPAKRSWLSVPLRVSGPGPPILVSASFSWQTSSNSVSRRSSKNSPSTHLARIIHGNEFCL
jgi:hypothetical protein